MVWVLCPGKNHREKNTVGGGQVHPPLWPHGDTGGHHGTTLSTSPRRLTHPSEPAPRWQ